MKHATALVLWSALPRLGYNRLYLDAFTLQDDNDSSVDDNEEEWRGRLKYKHWRAGFDVCVLDFSLAQKLGFCQAFGEAVAQRFGVPEADFASAAKMFADALLKQLKGCLFHFLQSVKRICEKGRIPVENIDEFKKDARSLTAYTAGASVLSVAQFDLIVRKWRTHAAYRRIKDWVNWWMRDAIAEMTFPCKFVGDFEAWQNGMLCICDSAVR